MARKNWLSKSVLLLLVVRAQACVSWPIRGLQTEGSALKSMCGHIAAFVLLKRQPGWNTWMFNTSEVPVWTDFVSSGLMLSKRCWTDMNATVRTDELTDKQPLWTVLLTHFMLSTSSPCTLGGKAYLKPFFLITCFHLWVKCFASVWTSSSLCTRWPKLQKGHS